MSRRILVAASILGLSALSQAQQEVDPSTLVPILSPVVDLGAFNWNTKQWMTPEATARVRGTTTIVYNNTCTWTVANYYSGNSGTCTTYIDEGRIPSTTSPNAPTGATNTNDIVTIEIGYCSLAATGTVDVKLGFYDNLGGGCLATLGGVPYATPLSSIAAGYFDLGAAAGYPLPGNSACYSFTLNLGNTGFCLQSDGNGVWDNGALNDELFNWSFESDSPPSGTAASTGPIITGEPSLSGTSGCTYNIACGTDPTPLLASQASCGHGLDTADRWWINHDNDMWGGTPPTNTGTTCPGSLSGSTCYWYGGHPGNPFASFYLKLGSAGECAGACTGLPVTYCTPGTTSAASGSCVAVIGLRAGDIPQVSNPGPAFIDATTLPGQRTGLIFMSLAQLASPTAWGPNGHFLCIAAPTQRSLASNSGGTNGVCDGQISLDINGELATVGIFGNPPTAGQNINLQCWFRDPASSKTTAMTNAVQISMCP